MVRGRLIGDAVGSKVSPQQFGQPLGRVAEQTYRLRPPRGARLLNPTDRLVDVLRSSIEITRVEAPANPRGVDLHTQGYTPVHGDRERLRAAHAAEPRGQYHAPLERPTEPARAAFGKCLEGALQDALRADVYPRAGGHLPVHRQAECFEAMKLVPRRPRRDEHCVGDEHSWRSLVRPEDTHRLAGLDEQRFVSLKLPESRN